MENLGDDGIVSYIISLVGVKMPKYSSLARRDVLFLHPTSLRRQAGIVLPYNYLKNSKF